MATNASTLTDDPAETRPADATRADADALAALSDSLERVEQVLWEHGDSELPEDVDRDLAAVVEAVWALQSTVADRRDE